MITTYLIENNFLKKSSNDAIDNATIWIDLFNITPEEKLIIQNLLNIDIPTPQDITQIAVSERLYVENDALYLTVTQLIYLDNGFPETQSIVFILHKNRLITVRYIDLKPFNNYLNRVSKKQISTSYTSDNVLLELLNCVVSELSNIVQSITIQMDIYGRIIFDTTSKSTNYSEILEKIGRQSDLLSKCRESLFSLTMALQYTLKSSPFKQSKHITDALNTLLSDIDSIINFSHFISDEIARTLDATLGMIAIEQNDLIKIFSIASIFFLPPTLIASIYGMNFEFMPELHSYYGYPMVLLSMVISVFIPYRYCKKRKWL